MNKHMLQWNEESSLSKNPYKDQISIIEKNEGITAANNLQENALLSEKIYDIRRKREKLFGIELFSDPAWDILLDLYVSETRRKKIDVTSACIAAGVPASTGLRWIAILVQNGYVERREDPADARRSLVSLTPLARNKLETLLEQIRREQG